MSVEDTQGQHETAEEEQHPDQSQGEDKIVMEEKKDSLQPQTGLIQTDDKVT